MQIHRFHCITVLLLMLATNHIDYISTFSILGIFPHFGYSHFKVFYPLLRNLAEKGGHNVTVITYIESKDPSLPNYEELLLKTDAVINVVPLSEWRPRTWNGLLEEYIGLHEEGQESCERLFKSGYLHQVLQRHKENSPYDIVITEYFNSDCQLVVPYLMQTPVVALSSCLLMPWYYDRILLPDTPSFVQSEFIGFPTPLNWFERLTNFLQAKVLSLLYRLYTNQLDNELIFRHLNVKVDVNTIAKKQTRFVLGNQHYSLMGIRPHSEQFIEIGGIHIKEKEVNATLPLEIESFLKMSKGDVLFISWGSMIRSSTLDQDKLITMLSVLKSLNLNVIWKWETDEVPVNDEKFLFIKWAPQLTLLCHPKVKLFWGHGGLLGTTEAVYCGKPMILTPIYGDQFVNAYAVENRQIGRIVNFDEITETNLNNAIRQIQEISYTNNAKEISRIFRDRPSKPLDTATWWVEHLLNHKRTSEVLHTHAVDLNWFVYYSLDVISILMMTCVVLILSLKYFIKLAKNVVLNRRQETTAVGRDQKLKQK